MRDYACVGSPVWQTEKGDRYEVNKHDWAT